MVMRVMIDPGHGGRDSGAVGPSGIPEKDIALAVSLQLAGMFSMNDLVEAHLTRYDDHFEELGERCNFANSWEAHCFISIHCNAAEVASARGFEFWTSPGLTRADSLASKMWLAFRSTFPAMKGRLDGTDGDEDKEARFSVLVGTNMPAVLVELGFITNPDEEGWLLSPPEQALMVAALSSATYNWGERHGYFE
jgi:N-acetylmuramoyl-L-alanine amidase